MDLLTLLPLVGTGAVTAASIFTAFTDTPDPSTRWGKVYRVIEAVALVTERAKQKGLIPTNAVADKFAADAVEIARDVLARGQSRCSSARL